MVIPIRDENPTRRFPLVTVALIVVNLFVYFGVQTPKDQSGEGQAFIYEYAAIPCEVDVGRPLTEAQIRTGECDISQFGQPDPTREVFPDKNVWLAVLFSMFMHGSILHVLGNLLFLWIFGNNVEDRLGPLAYLVVYLVTGLAAAAAHIGLNLDSVIPVIGASGAIAGVMGAYIVWFPHARVLSLVPLLFFFTFIELPAIVVLGIWFVLQFFTSPDQGVAWLAHVGGFVAGAAIAYLVTLVLGPPKPVPPRPRPARRRGWGGGRGRRDDDDGWDGGFRGGYRGRL